MNPFTYARAADVEGALRELPGPGKTKFLGGGTNLIDLMKMGVEQPAKLIDVHRLPLQDVTELPAGKGLRIGAMATNAAVAGHPLIVERYPVLSQALLAGASPQLRNRATTGGNLLQKTRCYYFYDPALGGCNKRQPGSGCSAIQGYNRMHAILGASESCIATHPSDMSVALMALDAVVQVKSSRGERAIPLDEFYLLPGDTPQIDNQLAVDELIVGVDLPATPFAKNSHYLKMRDRASYAFALVSAAVAVSLVGGKIQDLRIALGGVAHKPWRAHAAEQILLGNAPSKTIFQAAAEAALADAKGYAHNTFKIELARRTLVQVLHTALPV